MNKNNCFLLIRVAAHAFLLPFLLTKFMALLVNKNFIFAFVNANAKLILQIRVIFFKVIAY